MRRKTAADGSAATITSGVHDTNEETGAAHAGIIRNDDDRDKLIDCLLTQQGNPSSRAQAVEDRGQRIDDYEIERAFSPLINRYCPVLAMEVVVVYLI